MAGLAEEYASEDVAIVDVVRFADSATVLANYSEGFDDYMAVRTEPADRVMKDYEITEIINPCATYALIDLTTMEVLVSNCGSTTEAAETCITDNL